MLTDKCWGGIMFLEGGDTYFKVIMFWLIVSNIFKNDLLFFNYHMHRRYLVEQKQENSAFTKEDLKQHMPTLSVWCLHGVHL